jgi:arsenate reductase
MVDGRAATDEAPFADNRYDLPVITVVFACVHNAGRSQMAAAIFNAFADPEIARAVSAGTDPAERVHPEVVQVMHEVGVDLGAARPKKLSDEIARDADWLITMGCGDQCPVIPGVRRDDWPIEDPKGKSLVEVRRIREEIELRVRSFLWLLNA